MQALIVIKPLAKEVESVAEKLTAIKNVDRMMLLETEEILVWITFSDTDSLTSMLKQMRQIPGVQSTETKLVLNRIRSQAF